MKTMDESDRLEPGQYPPILREYEFDLRVRYQETDGQQRVHHSNYLNYFEVARGEMLRACGRSYRDMEDSGLMLVVSSASLKYLYPAKFDDLLRIRVTLTETRKTRATFCYQISLDGRLVAEGETVLACLSSEGKIARLPDWLTVN